MSLNVDKLPDDILAYEFMLNQQNTEILKLLHYEGNSNRVLRLIDMSISSMKNYYAINFMAELLSEGIFEVLYSIHFVVPGIVEIGINKAISKGNILVLEQLIENWGFNFSDDSLSYVRDADTYRYLNRYFDMRIFDKQLFWNALYYEKIDFLKFLLTTSPKILVDVDVIEYFRRLNQNNNYYETLIKFFENESDTNIVSELIKYYAFCLLIMKAYRLARNKRAVFKIIINDDPGSRWLDHSNIPIYDLNDFMRLIRSDVSFQRKQKSYQSHYYPEQKFLGTEDEPDLETEIIEASKRGFVPETLEYEFLTHKYLIKNNLIDDLEMLIDHDLKTGDVDPTYQNRLITEFRLLMLLGTEKQAIDFYGYSGNELTHDFAFELKLSLAREFENLYNMIKHNTSANLQEIELDAEILKRSYYSVSEDEFYKMFSEENLVSDLPFLNMLDLNEGDVLAWDDVRLFKLMNPNIDDQTIINCLNFGSTKIIDYIIDKYDISLPNNIGIGEVGAGDPTLGFINIQQLATHRNDDEIANLLEMIKNKIPYVEIHISVLYNISNLPKTIQKLNELSQKRNEDGNLTNIVTFDGTIHMTSQLDDPLRNKYSKIPFDSYPVIEASVENDAGDKGESLINFLRLDSLRGYFWAYIFHQEGYLGYAADVVPKEQVREITSYPVFKLISVYYE